MEEFTGIFIDGTRSGHTPEQCDRTYTIKEFIDYLENLEDLFGEDTPIYLYNDNGYTCGHINERTIDVGRFTEHGVEFGIDVD